MVCSRVVSDFLVGVLARICTNAVVAGRARVIVLFVDTSLTTFAYQVDVQVRGFGAWNICMPRLLFIASSSRSMSITFQMLVLASV